MTDQLLRACTSGEMMAGLRPIPRFDHGVTYGKSAYLQSATDVADRLASSSYDMFADLIYKIYYMD